MKTPFTLAAAQMTSTSDVEHNLAEAERLIRAGAGRGADLVVLPENFGFLGDEAGLLAHAQDAQSGRFVAPFRVLAHELGVSVLLGSIPERGPDATHVYNTSVLIDRRGEVVATYRKIHLFDVDFGTTLALHESKYVAAGTAPVSATLDGWGVGLSICYDVRFPELYRSLAKAGARILCVPAAFTLHTGKDHWELLLRARAVENQCYVVAAAQFGSHGGGRSSWGKSMIIDPWGTMLATAPERVGVIDAVVDPMAQDEIRRTLPALRNTRL